MTYEQAVELAKRKEDAGYRFLYESTYRDKYYIALKYMQNEEDALDVLQDAYMKAFDKLDTLHEAEKFPAWLGMIVANTAKNTLAKKKPILFSEMSTENDEGDYFEYQIEDEKIENQPELSYTKEETKELVRQLISSLSEEQRLCILMFHIEDMSIREIAETLECSENTVKSRLNYGRKNLKAKAEELQKKGCKLYGIAPLPLLLYLLRMEAAAYLPETGIAELLTYQGFMEHVCRCNPIPDTPLVDGSNPISEPILSGGNNPPPDATLSGGTNPAGQAAGMAGKAAKQAFIHTVAGKVTVGIVAVVIAAGVAATVIHNLPSDDEDTVITESSEEETQESSDMNETEEDAQTTETKEDDEDIPMADVDYSNFTGLTKEEMTAMLAYAPAEYSGGGMSDEDIETFLIHLLYTNGMNIDLGKTGTADYQTQWNTEIINKMLSAMEVPVMTDENVEYWTNKGFQVSGKVVIQASPTANEFCTGEILSAFYNSEQMQITYTVTTQIRHNDERGTEENTDTRTAIFVPNTDGKYILSGIKQGKESANDDGNQQSTTTDWKSAYSEVINDPAGWLRNTQNVDASLLDGLSNYQYALFDMNQDGTPELIFNAWTSDNFVDWFFCTYSKADGAYMIANQEWDFRQSLVICNNQLVWFYYDSFSPDVSITSITMTPIKIENSGEIYSGAVESAPETKQLELYSVDDTSYISEYTAE